jgi:hypothetical protein
VTPRFRFGSGAGGVLQFIVEDFAYFIALVRSAAVFAY